MNRLSLAVALLALAAAVAFAPAGSSPAVHAAGFVSERAVELGHDLMEPQQVWEELEQWARRALGRACEALAGLR